MNKFTKKILVTSVVLLSSVSTSLFADDVDIFTKSSSEEANVLFIMDNSGSMGGNNVPGTNKTRMKVMQDVLKNVLSTAPNYLSIGIMNYGSEDAEKPWRQGGVFPNGVKFPIKPINDLARPIIEESLRVNGSAPKWWMNSTPTPSATVTVRDFIGQIADSWSPYGLTPIVDSLYEAALYYRGEKIKFGYDNPEDLYAAHPSTYVRVDSNPNVAVSPIMGNKNDPSICDAVNDVQIYNSNGYNNIQNWINGNTNGQVCPTDRFNPVGPGLASNCALTKHDCDTYTTKECLETYPDTCLAYDDDGSCAQLQKGECKVWGINDVDVDYCYFSKCKTAFKPAPNYISPITGGCKSNNIILMSDGKPNTGSSSYPLTAMSTATTTAILGNRDGVETIIGDTNKTACIDAPSTFTAGKCGPELTQYLSTHDNSPIAGDQFIDTLVIGFSSGITLDATNYLKSLVTIEDDPTTSSKEGYYSAQNEVELAEAFNKALLAIKTKAESTYGGATYSSNSSIALTHDSYAYIAVFDQSGNPAWDGNLKKYEMTGSKLYGLNAAGAKVRATTDSGTFVKGVGDLWTTGTPSNKVTEGGAANKITPLTRNILTNNSSSIVNINTATKAQLGVTTTLEKNSLLTFIKGSKSDGSARHHMGDIIHSTPVQLITSSTDSIIFISTNEGFVHAIQASTGEEIFAFMPDLLLPNIKSQFDGSSATTNHIYGIDGQITLWHEDTNHNGIKEDTEKAYIYFGLRRGGQAYYALDVTTPASPELLWTKSNTSSNYGNLGFTWSIPKVEMLRYKTDTVSLTSHPEPVLIFGGGYINDKVTTNPSGMGAGAYIINATTGDILESYTHTDMGEVPGEIRAVDTDRNGSVDRLYFADTKANIWRVDLNKDSNEPYNLSKDKSNKVTQFAKLGGSSADNRSFFTEPDVAIFKHHGKAAISVAIGSGLRPDPLNTDVDDYFFMLLDENVYNAPAANHPAITLANLLDAPVTSIDLVDNLKTAGSSKGWKMKLSPTNERTGEKVLSTALTYQNKVLFTSFSAKPITSASNNAVLLQNAAQSCATIVENTSKLYAVDLLTGSGIEDLLGPSTASAETIEGEVPIDNIVPTWIGIGAGKIPPTPQIRYNSYTAKGGGACTGNDCVRNQDIHAADKVVPLTPDTSLPRVYWRVREN